MFKVLTNKSDGQLFTPMNSMAWWHEWSFCKCMWWECSSN